MALNVYLTECVSAMTKDNKNKLRALAETNVECFQSVEDPFQTACRLRR